MPSMQGYKYCDPCIQVLESKYLGHNARESLIALSSHQRGPRLISSSPVPHCDRLGVGGGGVTNAVHGSLPYEVSYVIIV